MKNLITAVMLGIVLAGVSLAQSAAKGQADRARIAVVEFTPGPNASTMTAEAKRQLQASIAFELSQTDEFEVVDVRNTRAATQANLATLNADGSTSAAVKAGKQLGVSYVLTGTVTEYDNKAGQVTMKTRLIEVATGKVRHSGETIQQSTSGMRAGGAAEMQSKVLKPAIKKLTAMLTGL
jgi:TolB-like protein